MQDYNLYEYAVVRYVPKVEREEFLNIGVVLYCLKKQFLTVKFSLDVHRLNAINQHFTLASLKNNLTTFENICRGEDCDSPIAKLDLSSRFRWLTATRSTILQCSKVHPGFSKNLEDTLDKLIKELVL